MAEGGAAVAVVGACVADGAQRAELPVSADVSAEPAAAGAVRACAAHDRTVRVGVTRFANPPHVAHPGTQVRLVAAAARAPAVDARAVTDAITLVIKAAAFSDLT